LYQGYPGFLHGGISSLLMDSAMANCLFAHRISAMTARLIVRFLLPVAIDQPAVVKAWISRIRTAALRVGSGVGTEWEGIGARFCKIH